MSKQTSPPTPARAVALFIIMIFMIAAGISVVFTLAGNMHASLMICGGSILFNVVILILGSFLVAGSTTGEDQN